jgi:hypothetical protein
MRLMEKLGIRHADARAELELEGGYARLYHLVIHGWVPFRCILGIISDVLVEKLYQTSGISCAPQSTKHRTGMRDLALLLPILQHANSE